MKQENKSVVWWCSMCLSSELLRGSRKTKWKQMWKMEVFENRKGFWLFLQEAICW